MQPDTITLSIDPLNDANAANRDYERLEEHLNRSVYMAAGHLPESRDIIGLYRTAQKVNGNFRGVKKSTVKFTKDYSVLGVDGISSLTAPAILEMNFSFPVGIVEAAYIERRQTLLAMLDHDVVMDALNSVLVV